MPLYFITSNKNKFEEFKHILPDIEQLEIDLPEIQEIDAHAIVRAKLTEAQKHSDSRFIVEDTSLYVDCLKGLSGPLYKWFEKTIGNSGLLEIIERYNNPAAKAMTVIGYANEKKEMYFFDGVLQGRLVPESGTGGFSWDSIFQPDGSDKTFGDMTLVEKGTISMRRFALDKLKDFLAKGDGGVASAPVSATPA